MKGRAARPIAAGVEDNGWSQKTLKDKRENKSNHCKTYIFKSIQNVFSKVFRAESAPTFSKLSGLEVLLF